jgi:integrase
MLRMTEADLAEVTPEGKLISGPRSKPQLRVHEAQRWAEVALGLAEDGNEAALGALLTLYCGLRAGEVRGLQARDVDLGGALLWVDGTKSEEAARRVEVPEALQPLLLAQAASREGQSLWQHKGINWVNNWVRRICDQARVMRVCAQSMRGLHASLAREAGTTGHAVARQLGHATVAMHERAYADHSAMAQGDQLRALRVLEGGR